MYKIAPEIRLNVVHYYLKNRQTLKTTAKRFNIHYQTVFKWVKLYKKEGKKRLLSTYRRPWNRTNKELEEKIVLLKEKEPPLTVRKAKEILEKDGIKISIKGIWGVWKRYGYAGFKKESESPDFTDYVSWTEESKSKFERAEKLFSTGKIKRSAEILNSIPFLPRNELIVQIPDHLLNIRRQVEKTACLFGAIPLSSYLVRIKKLYEKLKKQNLYYSALRIGIVRVIALSWSTQPEKQLKLIRELKLIFQKEGIVSDKKLHEPEGYKRKSSSYLLFRPYFRLLIGEGITYSFLLRVKKGFEIAQKCSRLLKRKKQPSPHFMIDLGSLFTGLEDYKEAEYWFLRALDKVSEEAKKRVKSRLAEIFLNEGKYKEVTSLLKEAEFGKWLSRSWNYLFLSRISLIRGQPQKAISLSTKILLLSKREELNQGIFTASFIIASAYCSIGERAKAQKLLTSFLPFFAKNKLKKYVFIFDILLSRFPKQELHTLLQKAFPSRVKLVLLIMNGEYSRAHSYARKRGILSYFYWYIFFFPEVVLNLLEKGKPTGLPKAILRLPVFNKEVPVYDVKFLGNIAVYKNQKYLKTKLRPKDTAFLIQLALKAGEPGKSISLDKLYFNFWRNSINPPRNLSHLLVRIKKALKIPTHLLEVSYKKDNPVLINRGIHFITDYDEYKQSLAQAKALLRAGEWGFAKREFNRAFKLFRGEPFRKMYDDLSDDKRLEVLFSYEKEVKTFADELIKRGRGEEAEKLMKKAERIVYSE